MYIVVRLPGHIENVIKHRLTIDEAFQKCCKKMYMITETTVGPNLFQLRGGGSESKVTHSIGYLGFYRVP